MSHLKFKNEILSFLLFTFIISTSCQKTIDPEAVSTTTDNTSTPQTISHRRQMVGIHQLA